MTLSGLSDLMRPNSAKAEIQMGPCIGSGLGRCGLVVLWLGLRFIRVWVKLVSIFGLAGRVHKLLGV